MNINDHFKLMPTLLFLVPQVLMGIFIKLRTYLNGKFLKVEIWSKPIS